MNYLSDTCVFIHKIVYGHEILNIALYCKTLNKKFCVTDKVLDELRPNRNLSDDEREVSMGILSALETAIKNNLIDTINIDNNPEYKNNFEKIRSRYYGHLKDINTINKLIQTGQITQEQLKTRSFIKKDYGECSCIAVAMTDPFNFIIISEDEGKVTFKPNLNVFKIYKTSHNVLVWNFDKWVGNTGYKSAEKTFKEYNSNPS